jgi:hypothetical protein
VLFVIKLRKSSTIRFGYANTVVFTLEVGRAAPGCAVTVDAADGMTPINGVLSRG